MKSFPVMDDITANNSNNASLMYVCNPRDMEHSSVQCFFGEALSEEKNEQVKHHQSMQFSYSGFLSPRNDIFLGTNQIWEHHFKHSEFGSPRFSSCKKNLIPQVISPKKRLASIVGPRQSQKDYAYLNGVISKNACETELSYMKTSHNSLNAYINDSYAVKNDALKKFPNFSKDVDNEHYFTSSIFHRYDMSCHNVDGLENNTEQTLDVLNNSNKILSAITENELPVTSKTLCCFNNEIEQKFDCKKKMEIVPSGLEVFVEKMDTLSRKEKYAESCIRHKNILMDNYQIDGDINSLEFGYYLSTQSGKASSQESLGSTQGECCIKLPMLEDNSKNEKQFKKVTHFIKNAAKLQNIPPCDQNKSDSVCSDIFPSPKITLGINLSSSDKSCMNEVYKESLNLAKKLYIPFSLVVNPHILHFQTICDVDNKKPLKLVKINTGTFCTVYKAWYQSEAVAVKCPQKNKTLGDAAMMRLRSIKEWRILGRLYKHPNVVKLIGGVVMAPSDIWIITEYIEGGDLYSRLNTTNKKLILTPKQRVSILRQLLSAVSTLHSQVPRIVHKDLKINNILILGNNQVRLCDFGDAEEIFPGQQLTAFTAVTWQYASPEIIFSEDPSSPAAGSTEKVDIWSLGCIILELCYQRTPFWNLLCSINPMEHRRILQKYLKINYYSSKSSSQCITTNLPPHLKTIVESCLSLSPEERPTALQIVGYLTQHETEILSEITQLEKMHSKFECESFHKI